MLCRRPTLRVLSKPKLQKHIPPIMCIQFRRMLTCRWQRRSPSVYRRVKSCRCTCRCTAAAAVAAAAATTTTATTRSSIFIVRRMHRRMRRKVRRGWECIPCSRIVLYPSLSIHTRWWVRRRRCQYQSTKYIARVNSSLRCNLGSMETGSYLSGSLRLVLKVSWPTRLRRKRA
jgi:hypothetical protein